MAAIQLNFTLRTSTNVKTVHLLGSWDSYSGQLPLSRDTTKAGGWRGTFRFQGTTLKQGQRYWYYYIIDGYHVSHDPAREHTVEPTTQRKLNVLDVPASAHGASSKAARQHARRVSTDVPKGRALSPSKIVSPKPYKPGMASGVINYHPTVDELSSHFSQTTMDDYGDYDTDSDSDVDSDVPSLTSSTSRSSESSSPSSLSSGSSCCTCERYGITRSGNRVKLDCGGSRCGYSDDSCSSSDEESHYREGTTRRQGIVVRGG